MDEHASFETRAVLAPRRARVARLALLLPVVGLAAIVWAGISGPRTEPATAINRPEATRVAEASPTPAATRAAEVRFPTELLGLPVRRLEEVTPHERSRDDVLAVAGWYVPKAITNCPPLPALYRAGALPYLRGDTDTWAFCMRSGVLYTSRPNLDARENPGLSAVPVTAVVGVVMPLELETIGADATQVVVIGRFVESGEGCHIPSSGCRRELLVDHVAWTPAA
ncbi:MAG: hypothetical protein ABI620_09570 [Chloroflexota bacterium]